MNEYTPRPKPEFKGEAEDHGVVEYKARSNPALHPEKPKPIIKGSSERVRQEAVGRVEARLQAGIDLDVYKEQLEADLLQTEDELEQMDNDADMFAETFKDAEKLRLELDHVTFLRDNPAELKRVVGTIVDKLSTGASGETTFRVAPKAETTKPVARGERPQSAKPPEAQQAKASLESTVDKFVGWLKAKFAPKEKPAVPLTAYDREQPQRKAAAMANKAAESKMLQERATIERKISADPRVIRLERIISEAKLEGNRKRYQAELNALKATLRKQESFDDLPEIEPEALEHLASK